MINSIELTKRFDSILALNGVTTTIREGSVFGLIGTNGSGKSTFLKLAAGILTPDKGSILLDDKEIFENIEAKRQIFYISDDPFFYPNFTPREMMEYYQILYPQYNQGLFSELLSAFGLEERRKINTFSKGMKKQLSIILGLCSMTKYLFCDETFDGLDPVMRRGVKSLFAEVIEDRGLTPVIASHNLRELEDICDHVGLLHQGGILFSKDLEEMKLGMHKLQFIPKGTITPEDMTQLDILTSNRIGSVYSIIVRGSRDEIVNTMQLYDLVFFEYIPLSLEEIFISETEVEGYDFKRLII